ncbi:hypothetical protein P7C70_g4623, partial [Phenoliferia sp. Uapishka_3]
MSAEDMALELEEAKPKVEERNVKVSLPTPANSVKSEDEDAEKKEVLASIQRERSAAPPPRPRKKNQKYISSAMDRFKQTDSFAGRKWKHLQGAFAPLLLSQYKVQATVAPENESEEESDDEPDVKPVLTVVPVIKEEPYTPGSNLFDLSSLNHKRPSPSDRTLLEATGNFRNQDFQTLFGGNCKTVRGGSRGNVPGMFIRADSNMFSCETDGTSQDASAGKSIMIFGGRDDIVKPINELLENKKSCPIFVKRGVNDWIWMGMYKAVIQREAKPGEFKQARQSCQDIFLDLFRRHVSPTLKDEFGVNVTDLEGSEREAGITRALNVDAGVEVKQFMQVFEFDSCTGVELDWVKERRSVREKKGEKKRKRRKA